MRAAAAFAVVLAALVAPGRAQAVDTSRADSLEDRVVALVNSYRANHGLRRLRVQPLLTKAAARHAANMSHHGYFSHSWSSGAAYGTWIRSYWPGPGYRSWSAGENLYWAAPDTSASGVVRAWKNSAGHNANLLRSSWRGIGLGAYKVRNPLGVYGRYATVTIVAAEFGYRR